MKSNKIKVNQIGIVVKNIENKIRELERIGIGPFNIIEARDIEISYKGERRRINMKIALANIGEIQIELIEAEGESFYSDFLRKYGEGLNHLGIFVKDINKSLGEYEKLGFKILQEGEIYGVKWIYLNTVDKLGFTLELIEIP